MPYITIFIKNSNLHNSFLFILFFLFYLCGDNNKEYATEPSYRRLRHPG